MNEELRLTYNALQVKQTAQQVKEFFKDASVVTLTGSLGAGKTTLVAQILKQLGVSGPIVSPTFTYVNVYKLADGKVIYHFDLYRLDSLEAFEQAGFAEYLYQENSICFIEWPEIVMPLLTRSVCHLAIDFDSLDQRQLVARYIK